MMKGHGFWLTCLQSHLLFAPAKWWIRPSVLTTLTLLMWWVSLSTIYRSPWGPNVMHFGDTRVTWSATLDACSSSVNTPLGRNDECRGGQYTGRPATVTSLKSLVSFSTIEWSRIWRESSNGLMLRDVGHLSETLEWDYKKWNKLV